MERTSLDESLERQARAAQQTSGKPAPVERVAFMTALICPRDARNVLLGRIADAESSLRNARVLSDLQAVRVVERVQRDLADILVGYSVVSESPSR